MIHVKSLPRTPRHSLSLQQLIDNACEEAAVYKKHSIDGVIIENMHDLPYVTADKCTPEVVAVMTRVCREVKQVMGDTPCGVQILAAMNKEAIATAFAAGLQFIRCESYVYSHIADEGFMNACSGDLLRYRKAIGAEDILVFADIKKKHCSHAVTNDIDIKQTAEAAKFFLADGVIVTGLKTGHAPNFSDVEQALIIGSYFKKNGVWSNDLDEERMKRLFDKLNSLQ
ncbi:hypothetical protein B4U79_02167, partial [Dinothrombium tinctorium]